MLSAGLKRSAKIIEIGPTSNNKECGHPRSSKSIGSVDSRLSVKKNRIIGAASMKTKNINESMEISPKNEADCFHAKKAA